MSKDKTAREQTDKIFVDLFIAISDQQETAYGAS